jgi:hypothetical protein
VQKGWAQISSIGCKLIYEIHPRTGPSGCSRGLNFYSGTNFHTNHYLIHTNIYIYIYIFFFRLHSIVWSGFVLHSLKRRKFSIKIEFGDAFKCLTKVTINPPPCNFFEKHFLILTIILFRCLQISIGEN